MQKWNDFLVGFVPYNGFLILPTPAVATPDFDYGQERIDAGIDDDTDRPEIWCDRGMRLLSC